MTFIRLITNYNQLYRMKSISENPNPIDSISYRADTDEAIRICHRITFSTLIKFYIHWFCLLVLLLLREKEKEKYCIFIYYCCCWLDEIWYSIEKPAHAHILWILLFLHRLLSFCCWYTFAETNIRYSLCVLSLTAFENFHRTAPKSQGISNRIHISMQPVSLKCTQCKITNSSVIVDVLLERNSIQGHISITVWFNDFSGIPNFWPVK